MHKSFPTVIHWFQLCLWPIVDAEGQIKTILPYFMNCNIHLKQKAIKMQVKSHAYCSHCHCKTGVSSATYHSICHSAFCIHLFSWIGESHYQRGVSGYQIFHRFGQFNISDKLSENVLHKLTVYKILIHNDAKIMQNTILIGLSKTACNPCKYRIVQ